ncbi:MAG: MBL fold metallo-hydrolase [Treponema sp.]|nr:MBL fold metallo-hydrolase [Treponema sp.]
MKLSEKVQRLDSTKESAAYLIQTHDGYTLIDTSYAQCGPAILDELTRINVKELRRILLTHHDIDHIGNMSLLQRHFRCPVYINSLELPYIQGKLRRSGVKGLVDRFIKTDISAELSSLENAEFDDIVVLHTPGHTPGHSCFLFQGFLFSGDLFRLPHLRLIPSRKRMNWNTEALMESLRRTIALPFEWVCPAHYQPSLRKDISKFDD